MVLKTITINFEFQLGKKQLKICRKYKFLSNLKLFTPSKATNVHAGLHALLVTAISLAHSITRHVTTIIVHLEKSDKKKRTKKLRYFLPKSQFITATPNKHAKISK